MMGLVFLWIMTFLSQVNNILWWAVAFQHGGPFWIAAVLWFILAWFWTYWAVSETVRLEDRVNDRG